jgi:hypothetical protein
MVNKTELKALLEAPEGTTIKNAPLLAELIEQYPFFQPLHLLLAKANIGQENEKHFLATAALRTNGQLLHNVIFQAEDLQEMPIVQGHSETAEEADSTDDQLEEPVPIPFIETVEAAIAEELEPTESYNFPSLDEQEVFEEIAELDLHTFHIEHLKSIPEFEDPTSKIETIEGDFILENVAATDFFAFEKTANADPHVDEHVNEDQEVSTDHLTELSKQVRFSKEHQEDVNQISNYHDDKLPYTFLWWLEKTRKEHQSIFQPYAAPKRQEPNDLQQQYAENIFHIQSPFNAEEILNTKTEATSNDGGDQDLINNFIRNAPQIGIPRGEQIDNENKARKSAEDHYDLVTETLAKIYIEQMLFHKAIDTYEKLSLKFPEKSRYFADLIQSIKKKI